MIEDDDKHIAELLDANKRLIESALRSKLELQDELERVIRITVEIVLAMISDETRISRDNAYEVAREVYRALPKEVSPDTSEGRHVIRASVRDLLG